MLQDSYNITDGIKKYNVQQNLKAQLDLEELIEGNNLDFSTAMFCIEDAWTLEGKDDILLNMDMCIEDFENTRSK